MGSQLMRNMFCLTFVGHTIGLADWPFRKDGATRRKLADPTWFECQCFTAAAVADE